MAYIINIQIYKLYINHNITELYKLMTLFYNQLMNIMHSMMFNVQIQITNLK